MLASAYDSCCSCIAHDRLLGAGMPALGGALQLGYVSLNTSGIFDNHEYTTSAAVFGSIWL
jgi:hypothetical protein